jgi:hypothetical protein
MIANPSLCVRMTSRDGSPKNPLPSIRFFALQGYYGASAWRIDFCTTAVRCGAWFGHDRGSKRVSAELCNYRDHCICGNLSWRPVGVKPRTHSRRGSASLSKKIRPRSSLENNRNELSDFSIADISAHADSPPLSRVKTSSLFALRQNEKKEHRNNIRKTQGRQLQSLGPEWIWPRSSKTVEG